MFRVMLAKNTPPVYMTGCALEGQDHPGAAETSPSYIRKAPRAPHLAKNQQQHLRCIRAELTDAVLEEGEKQKKRWRGFLRAHGGGKLAVTEILEKKCSRTNEEP